MTVTIDTGTEDEETPPEVEEEMKPMSMPSLPPGTPWWGYLVMGAIPIALGGGAFGGISFVSANEVQKALDDHVVTSGHIPMNEKVEVIEERQSEIADVVQVNFTNILLLCRAQELDCITK